MIEFMVLGKPQPQGSMKVYPGKNRPRITSDNTKLKPWRQEVGLVALENRPTSEIWAGKHEPVRVKLQFHLAPPAKMPKGRIRPTVKPDVDKLCRAVFDALKGILYVDDGQVVEVCAQKFYHSPECTIVMLEKL